jgi:predicted DNA-binding transcriptional regulator YafY
LVPGAGPSLRVPFRPQRQLTSKQFLPYWIEVNRRNLEMYVVAFERTYHHEVRVFKLKRIERPLLLDDTYTIPDDFDPHDYLSDAWGIVVGKPQVIRLRFEATVAQAVRELGEPNLVIDEETPDGGLLATASVHVGADGQPTEFIPWLLSWGESVEVLAPDFVRVHIANRLRRAAEKYP